MYLHAKYKGEGTQVAVSMTLGIFILAAVSIFTLVLRRIPIYIWDGHHVVQTTGRGCQSGWSEAVIFIATTHQ